MNHMTYKVVRRWQRAPGGEWFVEDVLRGLTRDEAAREVRALVQHQQQPGAYALEEESR